VVDARSGDEVTAVLKSMLPMMVGKAGKPKLGPPKPPGYKKPAQPKTLKVGGASAKGPKSTLPKKEPVLNHKGEPCKPGWSAARTGCTPKAEPKLKDKLPKGTDQPKQPAVKKPPRQTAADRVHIVNFVQKRVGELLSGVEPIKPEHITQVKDALMKLTVTEIQAIKAKLGLKATGAKAVLAQKISELALAKKPVVKPPENKPEPPPDKVPEPPDTSHAGTEPAKPKDNRKELRDRLKTAGDLTKQVYAMHKIMTEQGKNAGDLKIHGMTNVEKVTSMDVGGISVKWTDKTKQSAANTLQRMLADENMPEHLWVVTKDMQFTEQTNKNDDYFRAKYKNFTASGATGGDGATCVYDGKSIGVKTVAHEGGHNLATHLWGDTEPDKDSEYGEAQLYEQPVTEYGKNSKAEDFAEACMMYSLKDRRAELKRQFPRKYKALEKIFNTPLGPSYIESLPTVEMVN
jgi:hypothetical protein